MTIEEAIKRIEEHKRIHKMNEPQAILISEALDMAIEALKYQQSHSDDNIKKQISEKLNSLYEYDYYSPYQNSIRELKELIGKLVNLEC